MTKNILLLVEGEHTEFDFFNKMSENFFGGINIKIVAFKCNIYSLYKFMQEYEFNIDLLKALTLKKDLLTDEEKSFIKENKFFMKFLIFDFDFQEKNISYEDKVTRLQKMCAFFNNESDQGYLFINYPMFEAIREYAGQINTFNFEDNYKQLIDKRGINLNVNHLEYNDFINFILESILIENAILTGSYAKPSYEAISKNWYEDRILNTQIKKYEADKYIYCLNTSIQLPLLYFGEQLYRKI